MRRCTKTDDGPLQWRKEVFTAAADTFYGRSGQDRYEIFRRRIADEPRQGYVDGGDDLMLHPFFDETIRIVSTSGNSGMVSPTLLLPSWRRCGCLRRGERKDRRYVPSYLSTVFRFLLFRQPALLRPVRHVLGLRGGFSADAFRFLPERHSWPT